MSNGKKFNVFNVMEKAADAIGVDFSKIGEDITGMSIEQISKLPLKERKIAVSKLGEKAPDWMLKNLFGENWLGAKLMARYVGGSGEDYHLDISKKDWKKLIYVAKHQAAKVGGWTPSTNPDFPAEKGWEYVSRVDSGEMGSVLVGGYRLKGRGVKSGDIYNALGETTIRRRKLKKGKYEYQIAGETFDFIRGEKGKGGQIYGEYNTRTVSPKGAKIINTLFPEYTYASEVYHNKRKANISSKQTMEDFGTPFRILSKYIGK
jgi:hypothetical protein